LAEALALDTRTMATAALRAFQRRNIASEARPLIFAVADTIDTRTVVVAKVWTGLELARNSAPTILADTREGFLVTLSVTQVAVTVVDALFLLAVRSTEPGLADAVGAGVMFVVGSRAVTFVADALGSGSRTVGVGLEHTFAVVIAIFGTILGRTVFTKETRFALAFAVFPAEPVFGAVVRTFGVGAVGTEVGMFTLTSPSFGIAHAVPTAHGFVLTANGTHLLGTILPSEAILAVTFLIFAKSVARTGRTALTVTAGRTFLASRPVETGVADTHRAVWANVAVSTVVALI